jgi:ATP-dependent Clp protease ATP-binding subunit ClpC
VFELFSDAARDVIVLAQEQARKFNHDYIGTEHLLLALISQPDCGASALLVDSGVVLDDLTGRLRAQPTPGELPPSGHIPFAPGVKRAFESAEAAARGLKSPSVGTAHLLLGVAGGRSELGSHMLAEFGIGADRIEQALRSAPRQEDTTRSLSLMPVGPRAASTRRLMGRRGLLRRLAVVEARVGYLLEQVEAIRRLLPPVSDAS